MAMAMASSATMFIRLLLLLALSCFLVQGAFPESASRQTTPLESFLMSVQSAAQHLSEGDVNFDPKFYVDLPLKQSLSSTTAAFSNLTRSNDGGVDKEEFNHFLNKSFTKPGSDLVIHNPPDFNKNLQGFLPKVTNHDARKFGLEIHALWKLLSRQVSSDVSEKPDEHTLLPLPHPVVVPGARFREVYYWDSYWIIRGLLVSKLYDTARSVVENLMYLVDTYGFIPNGARSYYLNRSQPPLLSQAVKAVYSSTKNISFVEEALPILLREHRFWSEEPHRVLIRDSNGFKHVLTRYYANWNTPRPESSTIDVKTAESLNSTTQKAEVYRQIATTAESGWDFSSRWMGDRYNLTTLKTTYILPVDLNSYLLQMENNVAQFAKLLGKYELHMQFRMLAKLRKAAIDAILWNEEMGQYVDYWLVDRNSTSTPSSKLIHVFDKRRQNTDIFISNFFPLWCGVLSPGDEKIPKLISAFKTSGLLLPAGITTSLTPTGQQWDYPNAWPHLQLVIVEGFLATKTDEGLALAKEIAKRWLQSNYVSFVKNGEMLEKYDSRYCGTSGSGGEYQPQAGFGWSNGVVLSMFDIFGWSADTKLEC